MGQHEKKTHIHQGHEVVLSITDRLESTSGDEQWKVIQESFNVDEVANCFAVNKVLSHWDGFSRVPSTEIPRCSNFSRAQEA